MSAMNRCRRAKLFWSVVVGSRVSTYLVVVLGGDDRRRGQEDGEDGQDGLGEGGEHHGCDDVKSAVL